MLPADFRLPERYRCPLSLGARPWRVLGRMCPEPAGELGALELGELLWEELVPGGGKQRTVSNQVSFPFFVYFCLRSSGKASPLSLPTVLLPAQF